MNNNQGSYPIIGITPDHELKMPPAFLANQSISESIEQKLNFDGNALAKTILFVCLACNGPIAPSSSCLVCKRTSQRKCTKCGNIVPSGLHQSCEYLTSLGKLIKQTNGEKR